MDNSIMKNKKIVIAGGSGFLGQAFTRYFGKDNEIIILGRQLPHEKTNAFGSVINKNEYPGIRFVKWDGRTLDSWYKSLEKADILINLAGKTVNCRYTQKNKKAIFDSRTDAVKVLGLALQQLTHPPKCWINASSATIYRDARDLPQNEYTGEPGNGFSVEVCKLWEKTFFDLRTPFTRKIALRMAVNLGEGGVMTPYFNLLKSGLGGRQGDGKQRYSWIHVEDTCRMIEWLYEHEDMEGVYNASSPNSVLNKDFMAALRKATGHRFGLPAFTWMLKAGARLIGTETELVLKSRWVMPTKMLESGFHFKYPVIDEAFAAIIAQTERKKYHLF
jgi:hypothetical protein